MPVPPTSRPNSVITLAPQDGEAVSVSGGTYRILTGSQQTNGAFAVIEMLIPPQAGPGPHAHADIEETFFVVEGEVVVRSETQTYIAKQGAFVRIPRGGATHSFSNETQAMARLLCVAVPAGLDEMLQEIGQPVQPGQLLPPPPMTTQRLQHMQAVAAKYGQEVFPPDTLKK